MDKSQIINELKMQAKRHTMLAKLNKKTDPDYFLIKDYEYLSEIFTNAAKMLEN